MTMTTVLNISVVCRFIYPGVRCVVSKGMNSTQIIQNVNSLEVSEETESIQSIDINPYNQIKAGIVSLYHSLCFPDYLCISYLLCFIILGYVQRHQDVPFYFIQTIVKTDFKLQIRKSQDVTTACFCHIKREHIVNKLKKAYSCLNCSQTFLNLILVLYHILKNQKTSIPRENYAHQTKVTKNIQQTH